MVLPDRGRAAAIGGLLGLDHRWGRVLVHRDRLGPEQLPRVGVHHGLLATAGGGVARRAELAVKPRLADEDRPQLIRVLVNDLVAASIPLPGHPALLTPFLN